jgi:hypothetical protein
MQFEAEKKPEIQDQIKVKVRREVDGKLEDLLIRVGTTPMNGVPVVFGRTSRDGCDRHVQVAEVVFRREADFRLYASYNGHVTGMLDVFGVDSAMFGDPR